MKFFKVFLCFSRFVLYIPLFQELIFQNLVGNNSFYEYNGVYMYTDFSQIITSSLHARIKYYNLWPKIKIVRTLSSTSFEDAKLMHK